MIQKFARPSRRELLVAGGLSAAALMIGSRCAFAEPADVEAELKKLFGGKPMQNAKIKLNLPELAENGSQVAIGFEVESPMKPDSYVKSLHIFADGNPFPQVFTYHFTPEAGRAAGTNKIRLAKSQNIVAVAEMSDGKLYTAKTPIKVTTGGCG
ncbi:MAG: thiosulfate oxidation carrier protein SoxY [Rhodomicrobium sp.]